MRKVSYQQTGRVHVVVDEARHGWVTVACGQDFPARQTWPADHMQVSCKRCRQWADDRNLLRRGSA